MPNFLGSRLGFWYKSQLGVVGPATEINLFYDESGSMNLSIPPIIQMRDTILKNKLISFYGSEPIYQARSKASGFTSERTWGTFFARSDPTMVSVINVIFQDEASPAYNAPGTWASARTSFHNADISSLRNFYSISSAQGYETFFAVIVVDGEPSYGSYVSAVANGTGLYSGVNGLSDFYTNKKFNFLLGIDDGNTAQYYYNALRSVLLPMGITLPP